MRAANPAGLDSAMRSFADAKTGEHIVHHHGASLDAARQSFAALAIIGKNARGQAVLGIIGQRHCFVFCLEAAYGQHGAESFFAHDHHRVVNIGQDGGRKKVWPKLG